MKSTITINLPKKEKERLTKLALKYGLSLPDFSRRILEEISSEMPEESLSDYKNPESIHASLKRALCDYQKGNTHTKL